MLDLIWSCHVCGKQRPDAQISVLSHDTSLAYGFSLGTMQQNIRYCNDSPRCIEGAKMKRFVVTSDA